MAGRRSNRILLIAIIAIVVSIGIYFAKNPYWIGIYPVCNQIVGPLEQLEFHGDKPTSSIDFRTIYKFKWDRLYIINGERSPTEISEIIGVKYNGRYVHDDHFSIVFIRDGKVVKKTYSFDCEGFWFKGGKGTITIESDFATFTVVKHVLRDQSSYELIAAN